jgi:hypothetical protein
MSIAFPSRQRFFSLRTTSTTFRSSKVTKPYLPNDVKYRKTSTHYQFAYKSKLTIRKTFKAWSYFCSGTWNITNSKNSQILLKGAMNKTFWTVKYQKMSKINALLSQFRFFCELLVNKLSRCASCVARCIPPCNLCAYFRNPQGQTISSWILMYLCMCPTI